MGQSIFSNVIIATVSRAVVVLLGLTATAFTGRIISVEGFGIYSLVLTIGTVFQLFADFGLYLTASREIGASGGGKTDTMRHIVSLRMTLLFVVFILGLIIFIFTPALKALALLFVILSIGLVLQSMSQLMMGVFQAYGGIWKATVGDILGRLTQVGVLWYLLHQKSDHALTWIAIAFTGSLCVAFISHLILVPHRVVLLPKISVVAWRYLAKTSWPLALMLVLNVIYFRSDILVLSFFRSAEEIGWYGLAYKIIENGLFFPAMLGGLLLPHISSALASHRSARANDLVSQGVVLSLYIGIILVVSLVVFAQPIILFIGGSPSFLPASPLLQVLSAALAIMFIGNIFGFALVALSEQRKLAMLYGFLVVFNIATNSMFIPHYGAIAAAITTVVTELIAMLTAAYIVYTRIGYKVHVANIFIAVASAIAAAYVGTIFPVYVHIGFRLSIVGVLYVAIGYTLGLWNKGTLRMLREVSTV